MTDEKRKKALQLFQETIGEDNSPERNKSFYSAMAFDGQDNLNINTDYQNYSIIANGGDIIITPDDGSGEDVIIHPSYLNANWISYVPIGSGTTTTVQVALDDLNTNQQDLEERVKNLEDASSTPVTDYNNLTNKPIINNTVVQGIHTGEYYKLVNGQNYITNPEVDNITQDPLAFYRMLN